MLGASSIVLHMLTIYDLKYYATGKIFIMEIIAENECKQGSIGEQVDRISALPDDIIHHILSFATTFESVRTSALAKRWKFLWTQTPILHYDDSQITRTWNSFLSFVIRADYLHRATSIERYNFITQKPINACFFQDWVIFVLGQKNVKELNIDMITSEPFELPCCESLRYLSLRLGNGSLELSSTGCFSSLETLSFSEVSFGGTSLHAISHQCPRLRTLRLEKCFGISYLNIIHHHLEELEIERCDGLDHLSVHAEKLLSLFVHNFDTYGCASVRIFAPNLQSFKWLDNLAAQFHIGSFTSLNAAEVRLDMSNLLENQEKYLKRANYFLRRLACAKVLRVEMTCFWELSASKNALEAILRPARNLKHLTLYMDFDDHHFKGIPYMLNWCPNLETLQIDIPEGSLRLPIMAITFDKDLLCQRPNLVHLWKVVFSGFSGKELEIKFVEILLRCAVHLKRMIILMRSNLDESTKSQITLKLMELQNNTPDFYMSFH